MGRPDGSGGDDAEIASGATLSEPGRVIASDDTVERTPSPGGSGSAAGEDHAELPTVARESYHVVEELRRGGMGRILRARDRRLRRPVAIKELLDGDARRPARGSSARRGSPRGSSTRRSSRVYEAGALADGRAVLRDEAGVGARRSTR